MDDLNFLRDVGGNKKLPPGFRFQPTDEEIVFQYLVRKTFSHPLPAQVIPEISIFSFDPWDLPGNPEQDKYFFSHGNGSRNTCSGYWKATGSTKRIICSESMPIVGIKRTLVFYEGDKINSRALRTDYVMHEYCVALSGNSACNNFQPRSNTTSDQGSLVRIGNWSLCHVFLKKMMNSAREDDENRDKQTSCDYFLSDATDSSSVSSSSPHFESSVYAEVSSSVSTG